MNDCYGYIYNFIQDNKDKRNYLLVSKFFNRFKNLEAKDEISKHIIKNKGYFDDRIYESMKKSGLTLSITNIYKPKDKHWVPCFSYSIIDLKSQIEDFTGFNNIKTINLYNNGLSKIILNGLNQLEKLILTFNNLWEINLKGLYKLQILYLSFNKLNELDLSDNRNIVELFIKGNKIKNIVGLEYLNLQDSDI